MVCQAKVTAARGGGGDADAAAELRQERGGPHTAASCDEGSSLIGNDRTWRSGRVGSPSFFHSHGSSISLSPDNSLGSSMAPSSSRLHASVYHPIIVMNYLHHVFKNIILK